MENANPFQLLDALRTHDVEFLVLGGHAVAYHGYPRATEDTDILFLRTPANEAALFAALRSVNARWIADDIDPATGIERQIPVTRNYVHITHLMMLITDAGFLDVFDFVPGLPEQCVDVLFEDCETARGLKFVSLRWLRRMKAASQRPKDLMDLENLPPDTAPP
jgi:hypothetical protein